MSYYTYCTVAQPIRAIKHCCSANQWALLHMLRCCSANQRAITLVALLLSQSVSYFFYMHKMNMLQHNSPFLSLLFMELNWGRAWASPTSPTSPTLAWLHCTHVCTYACCIYRPLTGNFKWAHSNISRWWNVHVQARPRMIQHHSSNRPWYSLMITKIIACFFLGSACMHGLTLNIYGMQYRWVCSHCMR